MVKCWVIDGTECVIIKGEAREDADHLERCGNKSLHDPFWVYCKMGESTDIMAQVPLVCGLRAIRGCSTESSEGVERPDTFVDNWVRRGHYCLGSYVISDRTPELWWLITGIGMKCRYMMRLGLTVRLLISRWWCLVYGLRSKCLMSVHVYYDLTWQPLLYGVRWSWHSIIYVFNRNKLNFSLYVTWS